MGLPFFKPKPPQVPNNPEGPPVSSIPKVIPEVQRPPANELEAMAQQAPSLVPELRSVEDQKRQEALATMGMMEAARAEKGNFCVTLGKGDARAVILVAPLRDKERVGQHKGTNNEIMKGTYTDYYILTAKGPRRVSFPQQVSWSANPNTNRENMEKIGKFSHALGEAAKGGAILEDAEFGESDLDSSSTRYYIKLGNTSDLHYYEKLLNSPYSDKTLDTITDEFDDAAVKEALQKSIATVQSPIQSRIDSARSQIQAINDIKEGLQG